MTGRLESNDRQLFDRISEGYTAKDRSSTSRPARRLRLDRTLRSVPLDHFSRVLEVGCGAGFASAYMRGRYDHYTGIDHSQRLIEAAGRENGRDGVRFVCTSVGEFEPEAPFDLIVMIGVLHHLESPSDSLSRMAGWLGPGGYLVANEPQPANPLIRRARKIRARFDGSYSSDQVEMSERQLRDLLVGVGLEEVRISAQGLFSTPFAEVVLRPRLLFSPLVHVACATDGILESAPDSWLRKISWNLVASGRSSGVGDDSSAHDRVGGP